MRLCRNEQAPSPLDRFSSPLERKYDVRLDRLERRRPHVVLPWGTPPITRIAEGAVNEHDKTDPATVCVYTDGSGIDGHVGTAAVAPVLEIQGIQSKRAGYMGTSTTATVYAAELRGMEVAFQIVLDVHAKTNTPGKCIVFTDNQAAIQAMANPNAPRDSIS